MICSNVQRDLMAADLPSAPPADVQYHLAVCAACRQYQERLIQVERHVALIPVPPTNGRAKLLRQLLGKGVLAPEGRMAISGKRGFRTVAVGLRRRLASHPALVSAVAASVLLIGAGALYVALNNGDSQPGPATPTVRPDPLVVNLLERDLRLANAKSLRERIQVLAEVAEVLHGETQHLAGAADPKDLNDLADQYAVVVKEGVIKRAGDLPAAQRRKVLKPIVEQLAQASREAESLAKQLPPARAALQKIAQAARQGDGQLRDLLPKETP